MSKWVLNGYPDEAFYRLLVSYNVIELGLSNANSDKQINKFHNILVVYGQIVKVEYTCYIYSLANQFDVLVNLA